MSGAKARCLGWFLARFQGVGGSGDFGFLGVEDFEVWYSRAGLFMKDSFFYMRSWVKRDGSTSLRWCHVLRKCLLARR